MKFIATILLFLPTLSLAGTEIDSFSDNYISCSNGSIYDVGDAIVEVEFHTDGVKVYLYESALALDNEQFDQGRDPLGMYIKNVSVEMSSEGEYFSTTVNGLLILSEDKKSATLDISFDHGEMRAEKLFCKNMNR